MKSLSKSLTFPVLLLLTLILTSFNEADEAFQLIGVWESEEKNLQIEMFEDGDQFAGRMIYFKCSSENVMRTSVDSENPNETLRDRKLLGMKLVYRLAYKGQGV